MTNLFQPCGNTVPHGLARIQGGKYSLSASVREVGKMKIWPFLTTPPGAVAS